MILRKTQIVIILSLLVLTNSVFSQENSLKGTVKVRKMLLNNVQIKEIKKVFTNRENPLAGIWDLKEYEINEKKVSLDKNTHILEFYDSTYRFKRIYEKPKSRIYEGTFPVGILRDKINSSKDSIVKFKELPIRDYHLVYDSDTLVVTELVSMSFEKFTYSNNEITFVVKEYDKDRFIIRTLYFVYERKEG